MLARPEFQFQQPFDHAIEFSLCIKIMIKNVKIIVSIMLEGLSGAAEIFNNFRLEELMQQQL